MKNYFLLSAMLLLAANFYCQVGIGTTDPSSAAMLEVSSTSDAGTTYKGFMPPRVPNVAARTLIRPTAGDKGLLIFLESTGCLQMWSGTSWRNINCAPEGPFLLAIQDFEPTPSTPTLPLYSVTDGEYKTGSREHPRSNMYVSPSRGYGSHEDNNLATVVLGPINTTETESVTFKLRLAGFSHDDDEGMDSNDTVTVSISLDGISGTFSKELLIKGGSGSSSDNRWGFSATRAVTTTFTSALLTVTSGGGNHQITGGISYLEITGIPSSANLAIKVEMKKNDGDKEIWVIDDAEIYGN